MVKENILTIKNIINSLCRSINRRPEEIVLIAVTKTVGIERMGEVFSAGVNDIGENRVQEAVKKYEEFKALPNIKWHLIGHLQTNKAKDAVRIFDLIHSVDTIKLAQEINKQAEKIRKIQDILIQVNTSFEETKSGFYPKQAIDVLSQLKDLPNIRVQGLMTIAPLSDNPQLSRPYFRKLRVLRDELRGIFVNQQNIAFDILSMGMSDDYRIAIEEGSNMIRLGRAILQGAN